LQTKHSSILYRLQSRDCWKIVGFLNTTELNLTYQTQFSIIHISVNRLGKVLSSWSQLNVTDQTQFNIIQTSVNRLLENCWVLYREWTLQTKA
jgi:hypothetical protein